MTKPLNAAWSVIAQLQNSQIRNKYYALDVAYDAIIERHLDAIEAGAAIEDCDPAALRNAAAAANRRTRNRARLEQSFFIADDSSEQIVRLQAAQDAAIEARRSLRLIFSAANPNEQDLLIRVGCGEEAKLEGLGRAASRKRLSRLRTRFAHLSLDAA